MQKKYIMSKKLLFIPIVFLLFLSSNLKAQILTVTETIQENDQWCWAACTKCVFGYYDTLIEQCTIAEYARSVITWRSFGTKNCCVDATQGCNYWNYMFTYKGSMEDILLHFDSIHLNAVANPLTIIQINAEMTGKRPFIFRWGWNNGGGHFLVGHGVNANNVYYMNPWFGEGLHIATRDWLVADGTHTWTHTNVLTTNLPPPPPPPSTGLDKITSGNAIMVYPNPGSGQFTLDFKGGAYATIEIINTIGELVFSSNILTPETKIDLSSQPKGIYLVKVNDREMVYTRKVVLQ